MRLSLNWLRDYVDIEMTPHELGELLTMIGLEVEEMKPLGQSLEDVVAARIEAVTPHPKGDNLFLCQVDTGRGLAPVVCSAPNLEKGAMVPLALPGATLPGGDRIQETRIRGEISQGMLLAEDELGLTDDHSGIMTLPSDATPGTALPSALPLSDWALDIDLTPNRPDCASVIGIAREIAAATGKRLKRPEIDIQERGPAIEKLTSVSIEDPEGCPRYVAGVIQDVELGRSPFWLRYRLFQSGIRSINNIVDVTNYVLLETGQPLHAFDYHRLRENRILVRRAREGETFTTLDGETRKMSDETLMICDGERSVALAGIMGGINSEIFEGTRDVLLESAFFDPVPIRRSSKRLGISTEASYRFERGIDIGGAANALRRAISFIHDLAGGTIARGLIDNYPRTHKPPVIDLGVDRTNRFLGAGLSRDAMCGYLRALEMDVEEVHKDQLRVAPPSFRVDITREADLMEEVARLSGYDHIPVTYPNIRPSEEGDAAELVLGEQVRPILVGLGFSEIITYSFISSDAIDALGGEEKSPLRSFVRILNPLT
ncbi:MAG: phenylalanine--tRNA ligase subunit beta, partial [Deltaproteobacteria bacterium]|nr:phenylalanine--tRNA ligase subunit beta [Deltaproteobacteria bacterium]